MPHAYQVWRQDFDQINPRLSHIDVRRDDGQSFRITARYVVDATGRDTFLSMTALRHFMRWRAEHRYRMEQARLQFSGGTTPLDPQ